jgi:hypothetical protein
MSDPSTQRYAVASIEGKTAREAVSKCRQRANFNWARAAWSSSRCYLTSDLCPLVMRLPALIS